MQLELTLSVPLRATAILTIQLHTVLLLYCRVSPPPPPSAHCGDKYLMSVPVENDSPVLPGATAVLQGISPTASICSIPTYATQEQSYGSCDGYNPAQFNSVAASALPAPVSAVAVPVEL
jgi:hypothetical protein